jgi:hypothetical protein
LIAKQEHTFAWRYYWRYYWRLGPLGVACKKTIATVPISDLALDCGGTDAARTRKIVVGDWKRYETIAGLEDPGLAMIGR